MKHLLIFIALITTLFCFLVGSVINESPVFDEIAFAPAGYQFLVNQDFRYEPFSPPLTREISAMPMLFDKTVMESPVFFWPRMMVVIFTVLLAVVVYFFTKRLFGPRAGLFSLFLFTFQPEILARGHYAMTDLITAFFIVLSVFLFVIWRKSFSYKKIVVFGIVVGFALASKFTSLPYLFLTFAICLFLEKKSELVHFSYWRKRLGQLVLFVFVILMSVWSTYFFTWEPALGYRFDPNRAAIKMAEESPLMHFALYQPIPLGSYLSTIKINLRHNFTEDFTKESVFWGNYSKFSFYGFTLIPIFLIKTPIPLLVFFSSALFAMGMQLRKAGLKFEQLDWSVISKTIPIVVILVVFGTVLFSHVLLVIRYILPVYPFMIIFASQVVMLKSREVKFLLVIFSLWYIAGTVTTYPHFISFTNEFIGDQKNAYKYIAEGNLDLGQGLISLAKYQKENEITNLQLAYFGTADPRRYGIAYQRIEDRSVADSSTIVPMRLEGNTVAISVTCWYFCGYYQNPEIRNLEPVDVVGGSILIFQQ